MTEADGIEREILAYALDGDTVQNLVRMGQERLGLPAAEVLRRVGGCLLRGEVGAYVDDGAGNARSISAAELRADILDQQVYTWLEPTPLTFERLRSLPGGDATRG